MKARELIQSFLRVALSVIVGFHLFIYLYLYLFQESLIFQKAAISAETLEWIERDYPWAEEVRLKTPDNVVLHGWFVKNSKSERTPLLIYFGGNAEEVSGFLLDAVRFKRWSVLLVNYRGYGLSHGTPDEQSLFNDAVLIYDTFSRRTDVDKERIVLMGRSLGTAVAVHLASVRQVRGVILVAPFDTLPDLVTDIYRFIPATRLMRYGFDSLSLAPSIKAPLLAFAGTDDRTIPARRSVRLVDSWGGESVLMMLENKNHITLEFDNRYWKSIKEFLDRLAGEGVDASPFQHAGK